MTPRSSEYLEILMTRVNRRYIVHNGARNKIVVGEKYYPKGKDRLEMRNVRMLLPGPGFAFKLDRDHIDELENKRQPPRLFHFLDNHGQPWSKRCDFVIFYVRGRCFHADCIEFKSSFLDMKDVALQLSAGAAWVQSLKKTVHHYTGYTRRIYVRKFVFGTNKNPDKFLDENKQLLEDCSIRYYHFDEVQNQNLTDLENQSVQTV